MNAIHPDHRAQLERVPGTVAGHAADLSVTMTGQPTRLTIAQAWALGHRLVDAVTNLCGPPVPSPYAGPCPDWCRTRQGGHAGHICEGIHWYRVGELTGGVADEWTEDECELTVQVQRPVFGKDNEVVIDTGDDALRLTPERARELITQLQAAVELAETNQLPAVAA